MNALTSILTCVPENKVEVGSGDQGLITTQTLPNAGVQEDALLALSALLDVMGESFMPYVEPIMPILYRCIFMCTETQICINAIGFLSDLCRVISRNIAPYCETIMRILMQVLQNTAADKSIRPAILSAFGDISLALGPGFINYLPVVLETLQQATRAEVDLV